MTSSPGRRLQARRAVLQTTTTDDDRRPRPLLVCPLTLCVGGPVVRRGWALVRHKFWLQSSRLLTCWNWLQLFYSPHTQLIVVRENPSTTRLRQLYASLLMHSPPDSVGECIMLLYSILFTISGRKNRKSTCTHMHTHIHTHTHILNISQ